jgi:hypothetical protein
VAAGGNHQRQHDQPFAHPRKHNGRIDGRGTKSIQR